ncbi:MAG: outer membrane protein assembly factor BamC [Burkholderiales bacterium]|nr:outer membrane protein assembly factor BamC [Burkholderiales bacterium]
MSCFPNNSKRAVTVVALASLLAACGSIMDTDKVNYKSQTEEKAVPLEVPPDLSKMTRTKRYDMASGAVSANNMNGTANKEDTGAQTSPMSIGDIQIKREGQQMWLEVARTPEVLWPQVKDFWKESGFTFIKEDQAVGLLETDWAENRAKLPQDFIRRNLGKLLDSVYSTGERDKFRIRLERTNDNKTEIYISQRGLIETGGTKASGGISWQPRPNDPELEKEFMRRLMVKLGPATPKNPGATEATLELPAVNSASELVTTDGKPSVNFKQGFDVTWRRLGLVLDRNGFTVEDRDRNQGLYFVRYIEVNTEEQGFFSRLFSKTKPAQSLLQYRLKITSTENQTSNIAILTSSGEPDGSETAVRIAKLLVNELK